MVGDKRSSSSYGRRSLCLLQAGRGGGLAGWRAVSRLGMRFIIGRDRRSISRVVLISEILRREKDIASARPRKLVQAAE